jgi:parallel beta-helix repeat protein
MNQLTFSPDLAWYEWGAGDVPVNGKDGDSMKTDIYLKGILGFGLLAIVSWSQSAVAETTECIVIESIPAVISSQGVYCLKRHVSGALASGAAIAVNTNNVTIDCNEFKVGNLAAGPATQALGISAVGRTNITVRNCGVRGFETGISLLNGESRVEDNRLDGNTRAGIVVSGSGSTVRRNEVVDTGGSSAAGPSQYVGIQASGGMDVIDNNVSGVVATSGANGNVYGILATNMDAGLLKGNRVRELVPAGSGFRRGIWVASGARVAVKSNTVVLNGGLLSLDAAIRCGDGLVLNGVAQDNTVLGTGLLGTALGLVNCTNLGGVNYVNPL